MARHRQEKREETRLGKLLFARFVTKNAGRGQVTQWCRVAIICRTVSFCIPLHFVITLEAPLDVEQEVACGSQGEEDGPPRNGNSIDSLGRLMFWGI